MTRPLPLLIATDENLLFAAATMLRSAQATLADGFALDVYAYLDGVSDADTERFTTFVADELGQAPRIVTDQSFSADHQRLMRELVAQFAPRFPGALLARLFMPALLADAPRAVYLDVDIVVVQDISPLWTLSLQGNAVGAVRDPAAEPARQLATRYPQLQRYLNSGVLAIDVAQWLGNDVGDRTVEWLRTAGKSSHFPDQDALNVMLMADDGTPLWEELDWVWNAISHLGRPGEVDEAERRALIEAVHVRHFAGTYKPWNTERLALKEAFDEHFVGVPFEVPERLRTRRRPSLARRSVRRLRALLRRR